MRSFILAGTKNLRLKVKEDQSLVDGKNFVPNTDAILRGRRWRAKQIKGRGEKDLGDWVSVV